MREKHSANKFLDVGIAEQTAVAMASAIAKNGGKPVFNVYSSFIQRTYDQLSQDLCIDSNPATILVQTASVNGMTDVTHLGIFDIPMISNIPNLVYIAPTTKEDYLAVLDWSIEQTDYPVAIRVPVAELVSTGKPCTKNFAELNKYEVAQQGGKIAVIALGSFYGMGEQAAKLIEEKTGTAPTLINPYYITGIDTELLESLKKDHDVVVTLEDGVLDGGFGEKIARFYGPSDVKVINFGLKKEFLDRYNPADVLKENRLTPEQIAEDAVALI
jgi:1-deoxy-D-xylulose-5-phosphate synthase